MDRWLGRVALITGGAGGIGSAITKELIKRGLKVAVCDVRKIKPLSQEFECKSDSFLAFQCDVSKEDEVAAMFEKITSQWGGVDILINSAGLSHACPLADGDYSSWRHMMDVNVLGLSMCTHQAIRSMRERGVDDGQIIHLDSMSGHRVLPSSNLHFYAATKFAVTALTQGLRNELQAMKSHIRVASVSPGLVNSGFTERAFGAEKAKEILGRYQTLEAEDVTEAIIYILSCPPRAQVHDIYLLPTEQPL